MKSEDASCLDLLAFLRSKREATDNETIEIQRLVQEVPGTILLALNLLYGLSCGFGFATVKLTPEEIAELERLNQEQLQH